MIALLIAGGFSLLYSLLLTPLFVRGFNRLRWGQPIRVDGPKEHEVKRGTPTMGGLIFLSGSVIAYFVGKLVMGETPSPVRTGRLSALEASSEASTHSGLPLKRPGNSGRM